MSARRSGGGGASRPAVPEHGQPQAEAEDGQRQREGGDDPGRDLVGQLKVHGVVSGRRPDQRPGHENRKPHVAARPPARLAQGHRGRAGHDEHRVEDGRVQPGQGLRDPGGQGDVPHGAVRQGKGRRGHGHDADDHGDMREQAAAVTGGGQRAVHPVEPFIGNRCPFFATRGAVGGQRR